MRTRALALALLVASCQRSPPGQLAPEASALTAERHEGGAGTKPPPPAASLALPPRTNSPAPESRGSLRSRLRLTQGSFEGAAGLTARASKVRGVQIDSAGDRATLRFRYEGPSAERTTLKSGVVREQLGLKLRARDSCNLVYVMWRLAPESKIVVSIKVNPDDTSHDACENRGYANLRPDTQAEVPTLSIGQEHELAAEIRGQGLEAKIDGRVVWRGRLPAEAEHLSGPAGFRSDNVQWTLIDFETGAR